MFSFEFHIFIISTIAEQIMEEDEIARNQTMTEEPYPNWLRFEVEGQSPWYKTPIPRTVIRSKKKLEDFLSKERKLNRMTDVNIDQFSFKRRLGLKKSVPKELSKTDRLEDQSRNLEPQMKPKTLLERLSKNIDTIDHRRLLCDSAKKVDDFQRIDGYKTPEDFDKLKEALSSAKDFR